VSAELPILDAVVVPGLQVLLVALAPGERLFRPDAMPTPRLMDEALSHPLPTYLPAGLAPRSFGEAHCAVDASGAFQVTWIELPLPADQPLALPWDLADGDAPAMQGFELAGRPCVAVTASWSAVSIERLPLVVTRATTASCWLVGGRIPIDQLARIAVSLPSD
jgi:hypothetical protein